MKTSTLPQGPKGLANDPIVQLRITDKATLALADEKKTFSLGRDGACDLVLNLPAVSSVHCFVERRPSGLRIVDNRTKNGTFFRGAAVENFELRAGEAFSVGGEHVVALTGPAVAAEAPLRRLLGAGSQAAIDRAMQLALARHAIAILGKAGCGHVDVAALLHEASARRTRRFVAIRSVDELAAALNHDPDRINHGSLYVHLEAIGKLKSTAPALAAALARIAGTANVVVYIGAREADEIVTSLGITIDETHTLAIPSLHERGDEVLGLLEVMLGAEMAKLTPPQRKALVKYRWPGNLDELRADAELLRAVLAHGGIRAAERATGVPRSVISRVTTKLHLGLREP
ncbi:MAG: FHA domain-containing protein [Deltaproteobacteria bacterium]|nr:FHA domain-containing protein [Deltaproteobacteria bacterium]